MNHAKVASTDEIERLRALLSRIRQWDMLDACSYGAFWKREIDGTLEPRP